MIRNSKTTLLVTAILVFLFAVIVSFFHLRAYRHNDEQILAEFQKEQAILSQTAASSISHIFLFIARELRQYSDEAHPRARSGSEIQSALKSLYQTLSPRVRIVSRMNRKGILVGVFPPQKDVIGTDISNQPHVRTILVHHTPIISNPIRAVEGFEAIIFHMPVFRADGTFDGSVAALVPLEFLSKVLEGYSNKDRVYKIFLTNEKGVVLTAANQNVIGQNIYKAAGLSTPNPHREFTLNAKTLAELKHSALFQGHIVTHKNLRILNKTWHLFLLTPNAQLKALTRQVYLNELWLWLSSLVFFSLLGGIILFGLFRWNHRLNDELAVRTREILESEKQFRLLFTEAKEGIYQTTPDGKFIQVNPALAEILGYDSTEALIKVPVTDLYPKPADRKKFQEIIEKNGSVQNLENHLRKKDGTEIIVLENALVLHNPDGSHYYQGSLLDITQRKRYEEQLNTNYVLSKRLLNYSAKISKIIVPETILEAAIQSVAEYFSYPLAWLGLVESEGSLSIQKVRGGDPTLMRLLQKDCLDSCFCPHLKKALRNKEIVILPDLHQLDTCHNFRKEAIELGYRSVLYLPLTVKNEIFGILGIYQTQPHAFSETELAHVQTFANLTSIALEKAIFLKNVRDSEQKYSKVVENALDGIFLLQEGKFQFVNQRMAKMLGYSVEEMIGQPFELVVSPQSLPLVASRYTKRLRGEKVPSVYRIMSVRRDGTEVPVELSVSMISYQNKPTLLVIVHDLSEQEKTEKALRDSETRYRRLFENALIGITQFFPDGSLLTANPTWYKMLKYENPDELLNVNLQSIFHDPQNFDDMMRQLNNKGLLTDFETRMKCRDGSIITVQSTIRAEKDAQGRIRFYEGVHQNITHRKQLEQELVQAPKMESIGILAGGIAHDFNNILTGIIGNANFIVEDLGPSHPSAEDAKQIVALGERATQLIRQLLTFSRKRTVERTPLNLNAIVNESLKMFKRTFPETIHFQTQLAENLPPILGNPEQIHQVLLNLSINARDAMPNGGQITLGTQRVTIEEAYQTFHTQAKPGDYIQLFISDTGTGIPEGILNKIFDPFFTTKKVGKGTGLGLSVVYGIVKNHNGFIHVYSEEGQGTTFRVYFPVVSQEERQEVSGRPKQAGVGDERILLVEDEKHVRTIARRILEGNGYAVVEALDGQDALRLFESDALGFDLIISDVVMPRLGGIQLMEKILARKPTQKFTFISGYSGGKIEIAHYSGPIYLVNKPFSPNELLEKVREILDGAGQEAQSSKPTYERIS